MGAITLFLIVSLGFIGMMLDFYFSDIENTKNYKTQLKNLKIGNVYTYIHNENLRKYKIYDIEIDGEGRYWVRYGNPEAKDPYLHISTFKEFYKLYII